MNPQADVPAPTRVVAQPSTPVLTQVCTSSNVSEMTVARVEYLASFPCFEAVSYAKRDPQRPVLMVSRAGLRLAVGEQRFRWHPGLLHTRMEAGWSHPLVRALALKPGHTLLDCSLGLGIDARFIAHLTGQPVVAIEAVAAIALMSAEGLAGAGASIRVIHGDALTLLRTFPSDSFDCVTADPMFPKGTGHTRSLDGLRAAGFHGSPGEDWVDEARRVARHRVVVRDVDPGELLEEMGAPEVLRVGRGRPRYGVWRGR